MPALLERLPGHLEQDPLLRIHLLGFARGNPEKSRVEPRDIADRAGREGIGGTGLGLIRMQERFLDPAVGRRPR